MLVETLVFIINYFYKTLFYTELLGRFSRVTHPLATSMQKKHRRSTCMC